MAYRGLFGILLLLFVAWLVSERRRQINWRLVIFGVGLQFLLGFLLLKVPQVQETFLLLNRLTLALEEATAAGTAVVFGFLGGGNLPFTESYPG